MGEGGSEGEDDEMDDGHGMTKGTARAIREWGERTNKRVYYLLITSRA